MRKFIALLFLSVSLLFSCNKNDGKTKEDETPSEYEIKGGVITEEVLNRYLDRAITESEYLNSATCNSDGFYGLSDDKRMLLNIGAKFIGRAMYT